MNRKLWIDTICTEFAKDVSLLKIIAMFPIIVTISNKSYRMLVRKTAATPHLERYEARANNHTFVFDVNRPVLIARNEHHLPWEWRQVAGPQVGWFAQEIIRMIEKHLRDEYYKAKHET